MIGDMKHLSHSFLLLAFFICNLTCNLAAYSADLYVEVKAAKLRVEAKHWAKSKADLKYGDKLRSAEGNESESGWFSVETAQGIKGFVHKSAVTKSRVVLRSDKLAASSQVDQADLVLAGKGFNQQVEGQMRSKDQSLNFSAVDALEKRDVPESEVLSFIKEGKLGGLS